MPLRFLQLLGGILSLLLGLMPPSLSAQRLRLSESIDISIDLDSRLVGAYNDTLLLYRRTRTRYMIQRLDTALHWTEPQELHSDFSNNIRPITIFTDKNRIYLAYQYVQRGTVWLRVQCQNGKGDILKDYEVGTLEHGGFTRNFEAVLSENKKTLILFNVTFEGDLEVFNVDLMADTARWQRFFDLEEVNYYKEFIQLTTNNRGDVFVIFEQNNTRRQKDNHHFLVYAFDAGSSAQMSRHTLPFPAHLSCDAYFIYDELNQQMVVAGLYTDNSQSWQAQGIFYLHTNFQDSALVQTIDFEESFMRSLTGNKRKNMEGITNFYVQQLILRRDGGVIFVAEQQLKYEYQIVSLFFHNDPGFQQADYLFENVLVASIHPNGTLHWKNVLFKNQSSENDAGRYASFFLFRTVSNLRLLYNDQIRWDTPLFEYVINGTGKMQRNALPRPLTTADERLLPEFRYAVQLSATALAATTQRNNKLQVVRIDYE